MAWIDPSDVEDALGQPAADTAYLGMSTDAANAWAFRRRATAGYVDAPDVAPDAAAKLGTILYAVALYRERGSVDSYASFEELAGSFAPPGTSTQINKLLGIGKPQIDRPVIDAAVVLVVTELNEAVNGPRLATSAAAEVSRQPSDEPEP